MVNPVSRLAAGVLRRLGRAELLRLEFSTPEQFAAFVDDPRARKGYTGAEVVVSPWHAPRPDWSGRLGPLPGVRSLTVACDPAGNRATALIRLAEPARAADLVRAAFPLFYPVRGDSGFGGWRVGVHPGAAPDLRWEVGGGVRHLVGKTPRKKRFTEFEVLVDAEGDHWLGDVDGEIRLLERPAAPPVLIDPKVHRPTERRQPKDDTVSAQAVIAGGRLLVRVPGAGGRVLLDVPAAAPLTATGLRQLRDATDIDVSGMGTDQQAAARVAELAAFGTVLHGAPAGLALDPALLSVIGAPFAPEPLLDWANRSLNQVRAVMRGHSRRLSAGEWPTVSVLLPTVRPELLPTILGQLAAQDLPNLEIVVGCHGFEAPDPASFPTAVRDRLGPVLSFDSSVLFGDVLARLSAVASGDLLSKVDDDDRYGPHHLSDLATAWLYSEAQLVGRKLALVYYEDSDELMVRRYFLEGYRWDAAGGASIIARGDLAGIGGWRSQQRAVDHGLMTRVADAGGLVYTCSGPGYVHVRHATGHTYDVDDARFKELYLDHTVKGIPPAALGVL